PLRPAPGRGHLARTPPRGGLGAQEHAPDEDRRQLHPPPPQALRGAPGPSALHRLRPRSRLPLQALTGGVSSHGGRASLGMNGLVRRLIDHNPFLLLSALLVLLGGYLVAGGPQSTFRLIGLFGFVQSYELALILAAGLIVRRVADAAGKRDAATLL